MSSPNDINVNQHPSATDIAEATKPSTTAPSASLSIDSIKSIVNEQVEAATNLTAAARHNILEGATDVWTTVKQPLTEVVQVIRNANSAGVGTPLRKSIADVRLAASDTLISVEVRHHSQCSNSSSFHVQGTVKDAETSLEKNLIPVKDAFAVVQESTTLASHLHRNDLFHS
ncbi:hypothetical protein B5M09_004840 [Aphanomyces astaci]|uniref:Uncharacterized protein n=1 Tax=Aphanomyces astaci TaxID=112090 RepID=A0A3R7WDI8_APHAT|nr:hypothetical protein B5M09_004840 [Aphanomyces astaci]